ncbi:MAG: C4-dicarboxylate TRAP transporter substrate-binding protein [Mycobacteriales bacterium]
MPGSKSSKGRLPRVRWTAALAVLPLLAAACGGGTGGQSGDGRSVKLAYASPLPKGGLNYGFDWWADEVEKRTDGQVTFERHYAGSMFGVQETFAALGDGRVDVGWLGSAFFPAELPLFSIAGVPFQTDHPLGQAGAFYELWKSNEAFQSEWEEHGVRPIIFQPWSGGVMGTKKPMDSIDKLKGLRLRTVGFVAPAMSELGVETVAIPTEELYEAIQRGVVDGYAPFSFDRSIVDAGVTDVAPYTLDLRIGHYAQAPIAMSQQTWSKLPEDVQKVLTEVAEEFMFEQALDLYTQQQTETCDHILQNGGTVTRFSDAQRDELEKRVKNVSLETWLGNTKKQGVDQQVVEEFREQFLAEHDRIASEVDYEPGAEACASRKQ